MSTSAYTSSESLQKIPSETVRHEVLRGVGQQLASAPLDIAFAGVGENEHLVFDNPPLDSATQQGGCTDVTLRQVQVALEQGFCRATC